MSELSSNSLMDIKVSDIKEPLPIPLGTYKGLVESWEERVAKTGTAGITFHVQLTGATDNVDPEAYAEFGGDEKLQSRKPAQVTIWEGGMGFAKEALVSLGFTGDMTFSDFLADVAGKEIGVQFSENEYQGRTSIRPDRLVALS